jgi:DltD protein
MHNQDIIKAFKNIALLALPIGVLIVYLEVNLLKIPNSYNVKRANFEEDIDKIQTLVLGSSQVLNAVNPTFLDKKAFNLANTSQSYYYDINLTERYLDKMLQLKTICVGVAYFSFFSQMEDLDEEWRTFYYDYFWGISCPHTEGGIDARKYSLIALYGNWTTIKYASKNWKINEAPLLKSNGFMPKDTVSFYGEINDSTGHGRFLVHQNEKREGRRKEIENDLSQFVEKLHQRNIKVVFFSTPLYKTYSQYLNKTELTENTQFIESLCTKYNFKYWNFSNDSRFLITDFANNDHLNERGAEKFSRILNDLMR